MDPSNIHIAQTLSQWPACCAICTHVVVCMCMVVVVVVVAVVFVRVYGVSVCECMPACVYMQCLQP